jgi:hypothetical protein
MARVHPGRLKCDTDDFPAGASIPVVIGFVRSLNGDTDIVSLLGSECRELDPQLVQVQTSYFLVQLFGQDVNTKIVVF